MSKRKTTAELQAELETAKQEKKITEQRIKILKNMQKELTRRERTHRLCVHGGMLERYLNPREFSDEQIERILQTIFSESRTRELLEKERALKGADKSPS